MTHAKALFVAAILAVGPMAATAGCGMHQQQAMTCADGSVYDAASNSCKVVTG